MNFTDDSIGGILRKRMTDHGLWPHEAADVIDMIKNDESAKFLAEILDEKWEGYPVQFHATAWLVTRRTVLDYIDQNKPEHWARPMFTTGESE